MADWWTALDTLYAQAWSRLSRGVADRRAAARYPTLATAGPEGWADARTVVLRGAVTGSAQLTLHTDAASPKVAALGADPRCTLLIWDAKVHLQIRIRARASLAQGSAEEWARIPASAQIVYGGAPPPGRPIQRPEDHAPAPDPARFTIVTLQAEELDLLHLGTDRHRRALYLRADDWAGRWIAP